MSDLSCSYHPQRTAVDRCQKCKKSICLEDTITYQKSEMLLKQTSYAVLCPICNYDEIKNKVGVPRKLGVGMIFVVIVFFSGFIGMFSIISGEIFNFITIFIGGFMLIVVLILIIVFFVIIPATTYSDIDIEDAKRQRNVLLSSENTKIDDEFCANCGTKIDPLGRFCEACGHQLKPMK